MERSEKIAWLEREINCHRVLTLDPVLDKTAYITERTAFYELLLEYAQLVYHKPKIAQETGTNNWGSVVIFTAARCLKSYNPERENFSHLFNSVVAIEFRKYNAQEQDLTYGSGFKISSYEKGIVGKLISFFQTHPDITKERFSSMLDGMAQQIASELNVTVSGLRSAFDYLNSSNTSSLNQTFDTGDGEVELQNIIPDKKDFTEVYDHEVSFNELLNAMEAAYQRIRTSSRPLISFTIINRLVLDNNLDILIKMKGASFYNEEYIRDIVTHKGYSQKEISEKFNKSPANASQIYGRFTAEVEKERAGY